AMSSHSQGMRDLTRWHGCRCVPDSAVSVEDCLLAVCKVVEGDRIVSASRMNKGLVIFFKDTQDVDKLVQEGFVVQGSLVHVSPLATPFAKVILSNVPPFLKNELLESELSRYGKICSPIKSIPLGCKNPQLNHIMSFRRQVYILLNNPGFEKCCLDFHSRRNSCVVFASTDTMRCFKCGV
ncbi:ubiquitin-conjugating enzyme E2 variant 3 isoform X3, partial [Huso huso]